MKIKCEKMEKCNISYNILFGEIFVFACVGSKSADETLKLWQSRYAFAQIYFLLLQHRIYQVFGADNTLTNLRLQLTVNI